MHDLTHLFSNDSPNPSTQGINVSMNIENASVEQKRENEDEVNLNSSSKWRKSIDKTLEKQKDWISALPDSILLHILSLCETYEAIRTGALSKRWQYVWTSVPVLIFSDYEFRSVGCGFTSSVNETLVLCRHNKLETFIINCERYSAEYQSHFNRWIRYAVRCNVEELSIFLSSLTDDNDVFTLPEHLFRSSCFKTLRLHKCNWQPIGDINWKNLRVLSIGEERITQNLISNILSGSPSLEYLELIYCYGYDTLNITSISLRKLVISGYDDTGVDRVEVVKIQARNILSLSITDHLSILKVMVLDVPSLVEAELDYERGPFFDIPTTDENHEAKEEMLKTFIQSLQHVKRLKVGESCLEVLSRLKAKGFTYTPNMIVCEPGLEIT